MNHLQVRMSAVNMTIQLDLNRQRMDLSNVLNLHDQQQVQPMDLDSSVMLNEDHESYDSSSSFQSSPSSSPEPVYTHCYPHGLSPTQAQQYSSPHRRLQHDETLPPVKYLLQNIAPPKLPEPTFSSEEARQACKKSQAINCWPPMTPHSRSSDAFASSSRHYHQAWPSRLEEDTLTRGSRRSYHSSTISPRSPRSPYQRIYRRSSQPQSVWTMPINPAQIIDQPNPPMPVARRRTTHNNRPYTMEMVDWMRYHQVDLGLAWDRGLLPLFWEQFPERYDPDVTYQCLSSRLYRDNDYPTLDAEGNWGCDEKGKLLLTKYGGRVRDQTTAKGKELDLPYPLVDRAPWRIVSGRYDHWVSGIQPKDRERARRIEAGDDPLDLHGKRANWRHILKETQSLRYKK